MPDAIRFVAVVHPPFAVAVLEDASFRDISGCPFGREAALQVPGNGTLEAAGNPENMGAAKANVTRHVQVGQSSLDPVGM